MNKNRIDYMIEALHNGLNHIDEGIEQLNLLRERLDGLRLEYEHDLEELKDMKYRH